MIPRLYLDARLSPAAAIGLTQDQAHYLRAVLRREAGAELLLFNARDGEFSARIREIDKKGVVAEILLQMRPPEAESDIQLLFSPLKRGPVEMIIQKGTELGVAMFIPVLTDRTNADRLRVNRLQMIAREATEQCGRLSVPPVTESLRLAELLLHWDKTRTLFYCDEAGSDPSKDWGGRDGRAPPLLDALRDKPAEKAAFLIGPEGGFSPEERNWLRALSFIRPVTLGPRILRADTAAIAAVSLWQAAAGDLSAR